MAAERPATADRAVPGWCGGGGGKGGPEGGRRPLHTCDLNVSLFVQEDAARRGESTGFMLPAASTWSGEASGSRGPRGAVCRRVLSGLAQGEGPGAREEPPPAAVSARSRPPRWLPPGPAPSRSGCGRTGQRPGSEKTGDATSGVTVGSAADLPPGGHPGLWVSSAGTREKKARDGHAVAPVGLHLTSD